MPTPEPQPQPVNPGEPVGPVAPRPTAPRPSTLEGSFDVAFNDVAITSTPSGPAVQPPSRSTSFRLDVQRDDSGTLGATITARWGLVAVGKVTLTNDTLTLKTEASATATESYRSITDTWKEWRFARSGSGALQGTFTATGEETIFSGDAGQTNQLRGTGLVTVDTLRPEARVVATTRLAPAGKLLPWDALSVELAEPVERATAKLATHVGAAGGARVPVAWEVAQANTVPAWSGVTRLTGRATTWPTVANLAAAVESVNDFVGLASSPVAKTLELVTLGPATPIVGFDDDIAYGTTWGDASYLGGGLSGIPDARCEAGGCLALVGPPASSCSGAPAGVAARLSRQSTGGKVAFRYRVLAHPTLSSSLLYVPASGTAQVAAEGGAVNEAQLSHPSAAFSKLGAPITLGNVTYDWATAWTTAEVAAPGGTGGLGAAFVAHGEFYCGGPPPPPVNVVVLLERIESL